MYENKVLVVEDDNVSRKLLCTMIESSGFSIAAASNGKEAIDLYNENPFPVVVTDLEMPEVDGNELINYINGFENDTVIIVQTAHHELSDVINTMRKGILSWIRVNLR